MGAAGALNENQTHFLKIVKGNTERLNILVNDLLDISRLESGRVTLRPRRSTCAKWRRMLSTMCCGARRKRISPLRFHWMRRKNLPYVFGDAERVRQIVANLVDNAYHYTPENGTILVQLHPSNGGSEVQVDIKDNGVGSSRWAIKPGSLNAFIAANIRWYWQHREPVWVLSIVKELVEMHKGRIWVQSAGLDGEGSTFSFTLPVFKN
jgi:signal transduction histidine kinase